MLSFKGMRFPIDVILVCIRWYVAYPLSYRHIEEMMEEHGVSVDHSTINRWAIRFLPLIEKAARRHKRPIGGSWRMDETYIKIKGVWKYLYRAVDKQGKTVDFLLTAKRDMSAAKRFFDKAIATNGMPDKVAMDKSGANKAAIDEINAGRAMLITIRQVKYLNNIVGQDHRAIKRVTRPMLGFKSFRSAGNVLAGVELMHMIRKGQFAIDGSSVMSFADQFYALAGQVQKSRRRVRHRLVYRLDDRLTASADAIYQDGSASAYLTGANGRVKQVRRSDDAVLFNSNIAYRLGKATVSVYVKNLFDRQYSANNQSGRVLDVAAPRTVGAAVRYDS